jgi:hypothetical protein
MTSGREEPSALLSAIQGELPPLGDTSAPDEGAARFLLQRAQGAFQKWPEAFDGFRARLAVTAEGRERAGWVEVGPRGAVDVALDEGDLAAWARETLETLAAERLPAFFKDHDGRFPIAFDEDGLADSLGRLVVVRRGGAFGDIRYRIDERARVRQRVALEPDGLHILTYESFARATPGRILPRERSTVVTDGGRLCRRELIEDMHVRVGHAWLPAERSVRFTDLDGTRLRRLRLHHHALV